MHRSVYMQLKGLAAWAVLAALAVLAAGAPLGRGEPAPAAPAAPVPPSPGAAAPVPVLEEIRITLPPDLAAASGAPSSARPAPNAASTPPAAADPNGDTAQEFARCWIQVWITADGTIRAGQVVGSTGSSRLDMLGLKGVMGQRVEPARAGGRAVDSWAFLPLVWTGTGPMIARLSALARRTPAPLPVLAHDQTLHLEPPYYPSGALERRAHGDCTVQVRVSATGHLQDLKVSRSSGSDDLDAGCLATLYAARFIPAQRGGLAVDASAEVMLHWQPPP